MRIPETDLSPLRAAGPLRLRSPLSGMGLSLGSGAVDTHRDELDRWFALHDQLRFARSETLFADDWDRGEPVAVMAFTDVVPELPAGHDWLALAHHGGGYMCRQTRMIATRICVPATLLALFRGIAEAHLDALDGRFADADSDADLTRTYEDQLAAAGLALCDAGRALLQESLYPVAAETIARVCDIPALPGALVLFLARNSD